MGEFGVKNELGFVWVEGAIRFFSFFSTLALCLAIT